MNEDTKLGLIAFLVVLLAILALSALSGAIFLGFWNLLLPIVWPGAPELSFLQAWLLWIAISFVGRAIFGGNK